MYESDRFWAVTNLVKLTVSSHPRYFKAGDSNDRNGIITGGHAGSVSGVMSIHLIIFAQDRLG